MTTPSWPRSDAKATPKTNPSRPNQSQCTTAATFCPATTSATTSVTRANTGTPKATISANATISGRVAPDATKNSGF